MAETAATVEVATPEAKGGQQQELHPYDFNASGPRNLSSPNWRDLFNSSWKDPNYKRMVVACFVQAVYLLELDRQEGKAEEAAGLAAKWWLPFKYKLVQRLVDARDGSIYGAILEWDRAAALADLVLLRPAGAPRAVLALRGTLLKSATIRRDLEDDLRFLAWESLKGSVRFHGALAALKLVVGRYGGGNVCVGGHSLGAGFALQVGKAMAKDGIYVECHLFNPPSVSLAMTLRSLADKASVTWSRLRAAASRSAAPEPAPSPESNSSTRRWVPHLYVNNSDYICCYYTGAENGKNHQGDEEEEEKKTTMAPVTATASASAAAKVFVMSKGPKRFLEAHGLQQWWADDMELKVALDHSELIDRQLRSLYAAAAAAPVVATQGRRRRGLTFI